MQSSGSFSLPAVLVLAMLLSACAGEAPQQTDAPSAPPLPPPYKQAKYATVMLAPDLGTLSSGEREALPFIVASLESLDQAFWMQVFGKKSALLDGIADADARRFAEINYGPWDRLDEDRPFLPVRPKPATSRFYPMDLQPGELEAAGAASADGGASLRDPYTIVRRDENQALRTTPFHEFFKVPVKDSAGLLDRAAEAVGDTALGRYLALEADALKSDQYEKSEEAWLKIDGTLGVVIGPLDPDEDHMNRLKRSYTGAVWVHRPDWDARVKQFRSALPESSRGREKGRPPVTFEVADLIHLAGSWNAGPKRFVLELPASEELRRRTGTRRLLLHNVARAKFDSTLMPLAGQLISPEQRSDVTFDAFFTNDLLLEMIRAEGSSAEAQALRRIYGEAAWIVGVARANTTAAKLVAQLAEKDETGSTLAQHYTTLVASAFRSLRFGSTSAQGPASLILLNQLKRDGAIAYDSSKTTYRIDVDEMKRSVGDLAEKLAGAHQAENAAALGQLLGELSRSDPELMEDLRRVAEARVSIDVAFASAGS